jgi:hypothetical protein
MNEQPNAEQIRLLKDDKHIKVSLGFWLQVLLQARILELSFRVFDSSFFE